MSLLSRFIESKVARRMVGLFVICALGPMLVVAAISYGQVSRQLRAASRERQHQASKNVGSELISRLRALEGELALADDALASASTGRASLPTRIAARLVARFDRVAVEYPDGSGTMLSGEPGPALKLSETELSHLHAGKAVIRIEPSNRLLMIRSSDVGTRLVAELNTSFLWQGELAPFGMKLAVLAPSGSVLFSSWDESFRPPPALTDALPGTALGELEWVTGGSTQLGSYWSVPTGFEFLLPRLVVLLNEERSRVFAPMLSARLTFVLVTLLSLWVVMLLALTQVRRSLVPLTLLTEGAQRVGVGNFEEPVRVTSGDEFEALAGAFNAMTGRLQRQFHALSARAALDRAMLSSLDADTIMIAALQRLADPAMGAYACLVTFGKRHSDGRAFISDEGGPRKLSTPPPVRPSEQALLLHHATSFVEVDRDLGAAFLEPLGSTPWRRGAAFPIIIEGSLAGVLTVATAAAGVITPEELTQLRQVTDQIAVALANARLVQALDRLNVGTLEALARTVDAKSPWTAGHSQRVNRMATELGRQLGLADEALNLITRGSLLHDIGKIAVPSAILDKPDRLTDAEYAVMTQHPRTGARILEPIAEYHRLIPIVLQHHEWFNGQGYPDGLDREAICFEARVVAVADVFDAISSERPYREAMNLQRAVGIIQGGSNTQFDPRVVEAFMVMIERTHHYEPGGKSTGFVTNENEVWTAAVTARSADLFLSRD